MPPLHISPHSECPRVPAALPSHHLGILFLPEQTKIMVFQRYVTFLVDIETYGQLRPSGYFRTGHHGRTSGLS